MGTAEAEQSRLESMGANWIGMAGLGHLQSLFQLDTVEVCHRRRKKRKPGKKPQIRSQNRKAILLGDPRIIDRSIVTS